MLYVKLKGKINRTPYYKRFLKILAKEGKEKKNYISS